MKYNISQFFPNFEQFLNACVKNIKKNNKLTTSTTKPHNRFILLIFFVHCNPHIRNFSNENREWMKKHTKSCNNKWKCINTTTCSAFASFVVVFLLPRLYPIHIYIHTLWYIRFTHINFTPCPQCWNAGKRLQ